jgi:hypothetical protein
MSGGPTATRVIAAELLVAGMVVGRQRLPSASWCLEPAPVPPGAAWIPLERAARGSAPRTRAQQVWAVAIRVAGVAARAAVPYVAA